MEKNINEGTSLHRTDNPILCANGCGFFGTAATMNLCSKCYRDLRLKEEQAASIAKSMLTSSSGRLTSPPVLEKPDLAGKSDPSSKWTATSSPVVEDEVAMVTSAPEGVMKIGRCGSCNKKVGVMGFRCRCGNTFCGSHRYPEEHKCEFDFRSVGREAIKKANPVVKADKINRF